MLVRKDADRINGLVIMQVDDSFEFGNEDFLRDEETASKALSVKPRKVLSNKLIKFNGVSITNEGHGTINTAQETKIGKLSDRNSSAEFSSVRASAQYVGTNCRPDICSAVQFLDPGN